MLSQEVGLIGEQLGQQGWVIDVEVAGVAVAGFAARCQARDVGCSALNHPWSAPGTVTAARLPPGPKIGT